MNQKNDDLLKLKEEYFSHEMSEKDYLNMKEKIEQAKKENAGKRTLQRRKAIVTGAVAAVLALVILPNTSASVAYAMSRIPLLSKWVEVVTIRDYQYEDSHHSADIETPQIAISTESETEELSTGSLSPTDDSASAGSEASASVSNAKKSAEEINAEIAAITDDLIAEFEENKEDDDGFQNMTVTSEILATTDSYFTLELICFQSQGSGVEWHYYYTIDLATGDRLTLHDLFTEGSDYLTVISDNIKEQMKAQMEADDNVLYWLDSDMPEWDFKSITDDTQFYLNENDEVVICFNEGDVGPMSMGCVEFTIPNEKLATIRKTS